MTVILAHANVVPTHGVCAERNRTLLLIRARTANLHCGPLTLFRLVLLHDEIVILAHALTVIRVENVVFTKSI